MNGLREMVTQMSSTGQPLSTKKRWMVIDKKIVFDNGVIPSDHTGNAIIYILKHMMPLKVGTCRYGDGPIQIAKKMAKTGVHDYPDFIMASWNNGLWVMDLPLSHEQQELLSRISAYSLYLTSIGDVDQALDPMQWDCESFQRWKWDGYQRFTMWETSKHTPFGLSVLPTPILLSSISQPTTIPTTTTVIPTVNSEMMSVFDVGLECVVTNWLSHDSASNPIRLMLQDNNIKTFSEFSNIDENIVKSMKYRFPDIIFKLLRYIKYINNNGDHDLAKDPTQWDKKDFGMWEMARNPEFADSSTPHRKSEDNRIQRWRVATVRPTKDKIIVPAEQIISGNSTENNKSVVADEEELEEDDDFDKGMIHVLTRILKVPLNHAIAQALRNDTVFEYLDFKYHGDVDINWVYEYNSISKQDTVALRAVNAYALYLSGNGDNNMAMDPTLWDVDAFNQWRRNDCVTFLANEVPSYIPPKLKNFNDDTTDRHKATKWMKKKKKMILTTTPSPFDAGITYILTNLLELPFTHPVALALQHDERFKESVFDEGRFKNLECHQLLDLGLNEVFYFRYPTRSATNTTVMRLLPERKARSIQGVIAYRQYLLENRDLLSISYDDPTQWDVTAFKKWRRASCSTFIASRAHYQQSRDELNIMYETIDKEIDEWHNTYDITDSVNSNGEIVEESKHDLTVNASELLVDHSRDEEYLAITATDTADDIEHALNVNDAEKGKAPEIDANSFLIDDDDIDHATSPPECENSIGDLSDTTMIGFDRRLEYLISNWLSGKDANNDIRMMFEENDILDYGDLVGCTMEDVDRDGVSSLTTIPPLDRDDLLYLTRMKNSTRISLTKPQIRMILDIIDYYEYMYWNGDRFLAYDPRQWDTENFEDWKRKGQPTSFVGKDEDSRDELDLYDEEIDRLNFTFTLISTEGMLDSIAKAADSYDNDLAITDPEARTKLVSDEEGISNEIRTSNVAPDNDVEIDNAKLPHDGELFSPKAITEFPTHVNSSPGFWDDTDDDEINNPIFYNSMETPITSPEILSTEEDISNIPAISNNAIPCIHSSIPNDGQILSLPLFSTVHRVKQADEMNTLIEGVNEEYHFWHPYRDEEYLAAAATGNDDGVHSRDEEYLAAAATDDDDEIHSRDKEYLDEEEHHEPDEEQHHEELIGVLDGTRQDILNVGVLDGTRQDILNVESNVVADAEDDVNNRNLERDQSHDDNNSFNYVDIEKEILQYKHENLTGEYETIVFSDGDDIEQEILQYKHEDLTGEYETIVFSDGDDILNVKLQVDNPPPLPPESNNHNQDLENCYNDQYRIHSELIDSNPSMIPNDGEKMVLFSSVSRAEIVNKILQIVSSIFLQLGCEWTLKKYRVDNDSKMDWILKWYRVDNELEWLMKRYTVDNDDDSCNNEPASRYDSRIRGIPTAAADEIDDLVYHDSNNDGDNEDNGDTFHDSIQAEDMIDDTYNDDDDVNKKPINNVIDHGEQHLTLHTSKELKRCDHTDATKEDQGYSMPDLLDHLDSISSNQDPLKRAHSLQRMLSSPMKRKDGECPDPEVKLYHQRTYRRRYLGKLVGEMDYAWGDNESMSNSPTVPEAALFLDDTLEVDVSIAEGSIFGILGSEKLSNYCYILAVKQSEKPMNGMHVRGQAIVETSMYYSEKTTTGTIGTVQYSKRYVYYGKKTTTGTVGTVRYIKRNKVQYEEYNMRDAN